MDQAFQRAYLTHEQTHWWNVGRRDFIVRLLARLSVPARARILDVGCSGGALLATLAERGYREVHGVDACAQAIELCHRRGFDRTSAQVMDAGALALEPGSFDVLIASDVLEHLDDDLGALRTWRRVLAPGGWLLVFVPAYRWLWSEHDALNQHRRRYTRRELVRVVQAAGLTVERSSYWNVTLLAPIGTARLLERVRPPRWAAASTHELALPAPAVNRLLAGLLRVENRLLAAGLDACCGVSAFLVARRRRTA